MNKQDENFDRLCDFVDSLNDPMLEFLLICSKNELYRRAWMSGVGLCQNCNKAFTKGRRDKKYCSKIENPNCRREYFTKRKQIQRDKR